MKNNSRKKRFFTEILVIGFIVFGIFSIGLASPDTDTAPKQEIIRIAAMGDIMMGTEGLLPADGGAGAFKQALPYLQGAQIVFGNLEAPLTKRTVTPKKNIPGRSYVFKTPPDYAKHLQDAGFNMVSLANNHALDYGVEGRADTMKTLQEHDIAFSGPPGTIATKIIGQRTVYMIAFAPYANCNDMRNIDAAADMVANLKEKDKDSLIIISFHGGAEGSSYIHTPDKLEVFLGEQRGHVRRFSRAMIDAGADLVVGHGPHVPRAMEIYKERLIAYSLGNFSTHLVMNVKGVTGLAPLLLADLAADGRIVGGAVVSFQQTKGIPPVLDQDGKAARLMFELGEKDFPQSNALWVNGRIKGASQNQNQDQK
jgi:hypothetical protein